MIGILRILKSIAVCWIAVICISTVSLATDLTHMDKVHQHYRCSALVELGRMTDADRIVCDELTANDFDLTVWETANPDVSIQLHEEVFGEFF